MKYVIQTLKTLYVLLQFLEEVVLMKLLVLVEVNLLVKGNLLVQVFGEIRNKLKLFKTSKITIASL